MVKDDVFGRISWEGKHWLGATALPYFDGAGGRVYMPDEDRQLLPPFDKLPLRIETGGARKRPSKAQQIAWQKILQRASALWDEAMGAAIAEYQRQRPKRVRYGQVVNNPELLSRSLPPNIDHKTMRELVLPLSVTIHAEENEAANVVCFVTFMSAWTSESPNVYIKDGKVSEIVPMGWFMNRKLPCVDTAAFGKLRRRQGKGTPWSGEVRLEPFSSFAAISVDRSTWDRSYSRSDEATSDLPWNVARGFSELSVYAAPDAEPSTAQAASFELFCKQGDQYACAVVDALFELYRTIGPTRRSEYNGANLDAAIPSLKDSRGLCDITELQEVFVFPDIGEPVALGFKFRGPWTGNDGIGVRWRDGRVEAIGHPDVADPDRFQRDEAKIPLK